MPNLNKVVLIGHLVRDPEVRYVGGNNTAICTGAIAVSEHWKNKATGAREEKTAFIDFKIWGGSADRFAEWYGKGTAVALTGKLEQEEWVDKVTGNKRSKLVVNVDDYQNCSGKRDAVAASAGGGEAPFEEDVPY